MARIIISLSLFVLVALVSAEPAQTNLLKQIIRQALKFIPKDTLAKDTYQFGIDNRPTLDSGHDIIEEHEEDPNAKPKKPDFCNKLACPSFKVTKKRKGYELREYAPTLWVTTNQKDIDYDASSYKNFMRLFNYIQGKNVKKQKIPMTVPVINKIFPGQGPACKSDFTMSFYLSQNQTQFGSFPEPTNPKVSITPFPKLRAYVRSFPGYIRKYEEYRLEAAKLIKAIGDESLYVTDYYYTGGYNSPFEPFHRHNEVWFIAK